MVMVLRLCPGGGVVVEDSELTIEQAQSLAAHLRSVGQPAGCCWCVGVWDEEEEFAGQRAGLERELHSPLLPSFGE
jgi:hypothetical protein